MIAVDVRGMESVQQALRNLASEQMPYAMMTALNTTAFKVRGALQQEMQTVFDRPTQWIKGQSRVDRATKTNLVATVHFATAKADAILTPHVVSGARGRKPYELALQSMGALPIGMKCIPSDVIQTSASGDPTKATIGKIINGLKTKGIGYFVIKMPGRRLHPGIWLKTKGGKVKPQFLFVNEATYRRRFEFTDVGYAEIVRVLPDAMRAAMQRAIDTAR